jgi:chorismate mutase/prephenate dehydratase
MSIEQERSRIDELDRELVRLLNERMQAVLSIGVLKEQQDEGVYAPARERDVLDRLEKMNSGPLPDRALQAIYREVMSAAMALERGVQVAYLGPAATFTHQAAVTHFGSSIDYVECEMISDVFSAVQNKRADYGVIPIENSTEGAVTYSLDEFVGTPLKICAEIYLPITQHLLACCATEEIRKIYSHPNVFGQCRRWLTAHLPGVELVAVSSTARAAEMAGNEPATGALAGELAADMYRLDTVAQDVQDLGGNTTRFLVIARHGAEPTGRDKTSIYFGVKHKAGALYGALTAFKAYNVNMTKIESRPSKTKAWEYYFFVDVEGHAEDEHLRRALDELSEHCTLMHIMGSYPRARKP